jgi:Glyoxalase/Bleomycin resistance protein/Dioxygenase superfamily
VHLAFGWCGNTQVELIRPIAGVSTYSKFLEHNPQGGMHHYCTEVDNYAQGVKDMESRGFPLVQSGRHNETRFAYFDTTGVIGALTEIAICSRRKKPSCRRSSPRNKENRRTHLCRKFRKKNLSEWRSRAR